MAQLESVLSEPGQTTTKYPAVRVVDDERGVPQNISTLLNLIVKNVFQFISLLPGMKNRNITNI